MMSRNDFTLYRLYLYRNTTTVLDYKAFFLFFNKIYRTSTTTNTIHYLQYQEEKDEQHDKKQQQNQN